MYGHLNVINRLLDCKEIDVNLQDENEETALILASENGHLNVVNRLLDCKEIDVNVQDKVGGNVLILPHSRLFPNSRPILFGCGF